VKFVIELTHTGRGSVTGVIVDTDDDGYKLYEVTILTDSTKDSQTRVLRELARHLDWFVDLSEGGIK
jgi:FMN phosphatase YigB (HAD superfamily)